MLQQLRDIKTAEALAPTEHCHATARGGPNGARRARIDVEVGRVPGPLPTLDRIDQIDRSGPAPAPAPTPGFAPAQTKEAVAAVNEPVTSPDRLMLLLERLRLPLKVGFIILVLLDLPFIIYVLCWQAGFDLTTVTYPLLTVALGGSTIAVWMTSHRLGWPKKIGVLLARSRLIPWMSLEIFPVIGFVLWRDDGLGSMSRLIPLLVFAFAFILTVGLPTVPSESSTPAMHRRESTSGKLPRVDRSRALSRW
jgi:hypothetical protein